MQRLLQIHHDLAAIAELQGHHATDALVVDIRLRQFVDAVTTGLNGTQHQLRAIHEFRVGHYNFTMMRIRRILVSVFVLSVGAASLAACGQKGALMLPTEAAAAQRATLPQTLRPGATKPPAAGASAPATTP